MVVFRKAVRRARSLRMSVQGPAGSGKTLTSLKIANRIGARVLVIDTEHSSADAYAPKTGQPARPEHPTAPTFDFDSCELETFAPIAYQEALWAAAKEGYDFVIVDSFSHAWMGEGGILQQADAAGGKFNVWKDLTPQLNALMQTVLNYPGHVIVTMRTKTVYETSKETINGKERTLVQKVGTAPVQKAETEYEFDIVLDVDTEHVARVTKSRCPEIADSTHPKAGAKLADAIKSWLDAGETAAPAPVATVPVQAARPAAAPPARPAPTPADPQRAEAEAKLAKGRSTFPEAAGEFQSAYDSAKDAAEAITRMGRIWVRLHAEKGAKPALVQRSQREQAAITKLRQVVSVLERDKLTDAARAAIALIGEYGGYDGVSNADLPALVSEVEAIANQALAGAAA